jgi:hypothetical protein
MIPVRFGSASRELVGFYHPAVPGPVRQPAILICNPFGYEAVLGHRMLRLLADRIARQGCAVLRFDYFGTGDSPGDDESASLIGWAGDIGTAHRELAARSGNPNVSWLGLRLGASLCAIAATSLQLPLQNLLLWDPVLEGSAYLAALAKAHDSFLNIQRPPGYDKEPEEAIGYPLTPAFRSELRGLNLPNLATLGVPRALVILQEENEASQRWRGLLDRSSTRVEWRVSDAARSWNSDRAMNTAVVPADVLQTIQAHALEAA